MKKFVVASFVFTCAFSPLGHGESNEWLRISQTEYVDRVQAAWVGQIVACLMGFQFEHKVASTLWVDQYPKPVDGAIVDDDWYYEMCALRAFEKHGVGLTVAQLGEQWHENNCGSWGSSEQARLNLEKGIPAPACGHPRYNKLWYSIGPQFSADIYGLLAPGQPNLAGKLAREFGHVNGYAEAVDGAVFVAGMVSLAFTETDPKTVVRKAAKLIHPKSPYRRMLNELIAMADAGKSGQEIADYLEDRWHIEYPATNNAMPNGGLAALGVWFGEGDFLKTVNIIYRAADFTDADCNAANAAAVIGAMHGMKAIPRHLIEPLHDRIRGDKLGPVKLTPPVDESISELALRTAKIGEKFLASHGGKVEGTTLLARKEEPLTQPAELFQLGDLMQYWNKDWKLERAGVGGAGGGMGNLRGITYLDGNVLATIPRDEVRGVVLRRDMTVAAHSKLKLELGADAGRAWEFEAYAGNERVFHKLINGTAQKSGERLWESVTIDLTKFAGKTIQIRLYQRVRLKDLIPGNAYWRNISVE